MLRFARDTGMYPDCLPFPPDCHVVLNACSKGVPEVDVIEFDGDEAQGRARAWVLLTGFDGKLLYGSNGVPVSAVIQDEFTLFDAFWKVYVPPERQADPCYEVKA